MPWNIVYNIQFRDPVATKHSQILLSRFVFNFVKTPLEKVFPWQCIADHVVWEVGYVMSNGFAQKPSSVVCNQKYCDRVLSMIPTTSGIRLLAISGVVHHFNQAKQLAGVKTRTAKTTTLVQVITIA